MYRLMKSEKFTLGHMASGSLPSYRQIQIKRFDKLNNALFACKIANGKGQSRYYVLNELGREFYGNSWID